MFKLLISLFMVYCCFVFTTYAEAKKPLTIYNGVKLIKCHDGDTCTFDVGNKRVVVARFSKIDTPELKQRYGDSAKQKTLSLLSNKKIKLVCGGSAKGNRVACAIYANGVDVQKQLVQSGLAFDYKAYSKSEYTSVQLLARKNKLGMWASSTVTSPYCYRHKKKQSCLVNKLYQP